MISLSLPYELYFLSAILAVWAGNKAWRFMEKRRWRWTISDWFIATFWIAVVLAVTIANG